MHWFAKHGRNMDVFRADVNAEMAKIANRELLKAAAKISNRVPGGINILMWSGNDREWKGKYADALLLKIADAWD